MIESVDLRSFKYQLEPLLKRAKWQLNSIQMALAEARKLFEQSKLELVQQEENLEAHFLKFRAVFNENLNLAAHRHSMFFILDAQKKIALAKEDVVEKKGLLGAALKKCIEQQREIELLENHQKKSQGEFVLEQMNLMSAEADRNWNARESWQNELKVQQYENHV